MKGSQVSPSVLNVTSYHPHMRYAHHREGDGWFPLATSKELFNETESKVPTLSHVHARALYLLPNGGAMFAVFSAGRVV